jgi:PAS domain S-box-containing protein
MSTAPGQTNEEPKSQYAFLQGGGESGTLTRAVDWSRTSLGDPGAWPFNLRTTVGILLHSAVPMFLFWGDELICFYNDAYRASLGNEGKHPGIGKPAMDVWPEIWHIVGPQIDHVLHTGETRLFENQLIPIYRNGGIEDVYWTYSYCPIYDESGVVSGVFATVMETTESVLNASGLVESEQQFRALVTTTADVVYRMSADWEIMWNLDGKGFLKSTDEPTRDWKNMNVHPVDRELVERQIAEAIRNKSTFQLEHRVLRANGHPGWTFSRAIPILNAAGEITEWFGTATDITDRRKIEEELLLIREDLERSKRLYETITDTTPDLIYVFDLQYRFTYANKALLAMWGKTWEESIGQGLRSLGYEEWHASMHEREIDQIVETRLPVRGTVTFPHAELGRRYYDYILTPVIGESGEVEAVAGTTRDVTGFKHAEAALRESEERYRVLVETLERNVSERTAELTRSNEDLQQFAHVASHDLKEPVRKILTFATMLEGADGPRLSELGLLSLEKVRNAAERMMNMVNGVLAYSKFAATDQPWERIRLSATIANVEADLEVLIQQKGALIEVDTLPVVTGVPVLIHQLFYNLLNNALKFTRPGGQPRIIISGRRVSEEMQEITVSDNGIGFEQEYADRIFKTFARLHSKDSYEGTGLGLSLCKRIVERHGGTIRAEGRPGSGASFVMTLPAGASAILQSRQRRQVE